MSNACDTCVSGGKPDFQRFGVDIADADAVVALAGNPNTGKTTLFNALTGLRMHVGNWPGKTVAQAIGGFKIRGRKYRLVDLPGTYSLLSNSPATFCFSENPTQPSLCVIRPRSSATLPWSCRCWRSRPRSLSR